METQNVYLTDDGRQRILGHLEFLRTVKRAEVARYLYEAKEGGDVNDNAAYEEARTEYALLEGKIYELEQMLASARPISKGQTDVVSLGSVVRACCEDGRERIYTIVGAYEANPGAGLISNESPVGKALLGHKVDDMVMVATPGGVKEYTIVAIE